MIASAARLPPFLSVDVGGHDMRTGLGQGERGCLADALAGAGHQCDLIGQVHTVSPPRFAPLWDKTGAVSLRWAQRRGNLLLIANDWRTIAASDARSR